MNHTPGRWRNEDLVISATKPDGKVVHVARAYFYEDIDREEANANANLIAAADDMLAALEMIVGWWDSGSRIHTQTTEHQVRAALKKARGEA